MQGLVKAPLQRRFVAAQLFQRECIRQQQGSPLAVMGLQQLFPLVLRVVESVAGIVGHLAEQVISIAFGFFGHNLNALH